MSFLPPVEVQVPNFINILQAAQQYRANQFRMAAQEQEAARTQRERELASRFISSPMGSPERMQAERDFQQFSPEAYLNVQKSLSAQQTENLQQQQLQGELNLHPLKQQAASLGLEEKRQAKEDENLLFGEQLFRKVVQNPALYPAAKKLAEKRGIDVSGLPDQTPPPQQLNEMYQQFQAGAEATRATRADPRKVALDLENIRSEINLRKSQIVKNLQESSPKKGATVPSSEVEKLAELSSLPQVIGNLRNSFNELTGKLSGINQYIPGTEAKRYNDARAVAAQTIGRIREGGKLTDPDYIRHLDSTPAPGDSIERAESKNINIIRDANILYDSKVDTLKKAGYDTSGLERDKQNATRKLINDVVKSLVDSGKSESEAVQFVLSAYPELRQQRSSPVQGVSPDIASLPPISRK